MKHIVTGGLGFIGSHLTERLLLEGNKVTVIDNLATGDLHNLQKASNLTVVVSDIMDNNAYYFKDIDTVFHLAALTRPQVSIIDPRGTFEANILGTLKIIKYCIKYKVRRLVFMSTTGLYGTQEVLPMKETAVPNPMSPYALSKLVGEQMCQMYEKIDGLNYNVVRPFNVYGPRQNPKGGYAAAVPKFIDSLRNGSKSFITGDGSQSRDFIYVSDVVDLLIKTGKTEVHGEAFNAGSGISTSINDLYKNISILTNKYVTPNYIDPLFEPPKTLGDISKAKKILGWTPRVSLEEGLKLTISNIK